MGSSSACTSAKNQTSPWLCRSFSHSYCSELSNYHVSMMPLAADSIDWALSHLNTFGDSDLFPKPVEFEAFVALRDDLKALLTSQEVAAFEPSAARRFMVPKDDLSFRRATQLNPFDAILLTAIIHQYGLGIEQRRRPISEGSVFSHRFDPQTNFSLYNRKYDWNSFWAECRKRSATFSYAVVLDISDFYNQIYHHTIEVQLVESGFPNTAIKWLLGVLGHLTAKVSRGVPVGPHAAHLLAEASLIPVDNSMVSHGINYPTWFDRIRPSTPHSPLETLHSGRTPAPS